MLSGQGRFLQNCRVFRYAKIMKCKFFSGIYLQHMYMLILELCRLVMAVLDPATSRVSTVCVLPYALYISA